MVKTIISKMRHGQNYSKRLGERKIAISAAGSRNGLWSGIGLLALLSIFFIAKSSGITGNYLMVIK